MPISSKDHLEKVSLERQKLDQEAMSIEIVNSIVAKIDVRLQQDTTENPSAYFGEKDVIGYLNKSESLREYLKALYNSYGWNIHISRDWSFVSLHFYPIKQESSESKGFFRRLFK
jgi:hypothetical protein